MTDHRRTFAEYGLRLTEYGLRITDYGLRLTDHGLRITDYGLSYRFGSSLDEEPARCCAGVLVAGAAFAEIACATFSSDERNR